MYHGDVRVANGVGRFRAYSDQFRCKKMCGATIMRFRTAILAEPPMLIARSLLCALIFFGIIYALVVAIVVTANGLETHRDCRGAFSSGFSNDFDRYRCELIIRYIGTDLEFRIPAPILYQK